MRSISAVILLVSSAGLVLSSLETPSICLAQDLERRKSISDGKPHNELFLSMSARSAERMFFGEEGEFSQSREAADDPAKPAPKPVISLKTTVQVLTPIPKGDATEGYERNITPKEVETSAGTFGDPSRFMQMLPGVVPDNDKYNDFIVRGGNSQEIRFVVDNIEMPSVNQLALSDTTGGFVSMIDNAAVQRLVLHTDAYDSKYDQRLSAIVEISTREDDKTEPKTIFEMGLAGLGSSIRRPWGNDGSIFLSGRRSILNWVTNDIGMNGVPIYSNSLFRADKRLTDRDSVWGLSLTGVDSMEIHPSSMNTWETNPYDITYKGWRNTSGINWQHIYSSKSFGVASFGNSEQSQSVRQNAQLLGDALVYSEDTKDGISTAKYDHTVQWNRALTLTAGVRTSLDRIRYHVDQPTGLQNPYSEDAAPTDILRVDRRFSTFSSAGYMQASLLLPRGMKTVVGGRLAQWAATGNTNWTPKVLFMMPVFGRLTHVGYADYAQLPPTLYLLAFRNQDSLKPIRSRQLTWGMDVLHKRNIRMSLEAYEKRYKDYPVALNFPQLSLANIANTFGQAFLMFPMASKGSGIGRGVELGVTYRPTSRVTLATAITYSRIWYSGLDGVMRKGNFDIPFVANVSGNFHVKKSIVLSFRYSTASGKPFTPDNLPLSFAQNRDVLDLTKINGMRAAPYSRLDFRVEHSYPVGLGIFMWHVGLDNALGTKNFYSNEWRPRCDPQCGVLAQEQMPLFPDGGFRYSF